MILRAINSELLRAVDDRFHPKDQAELVVHLQLIGLHASKRMAQPAPSADREAAAGRSFVDETRMSV